MIKITIIWEIISPFLQTISGTLSIEDINIKNEYHDVTRLFQCKITASNNPRSNSFSNIEGGTSSNKTFQKYKDTIDRMVDSYFNGLLLKKVDYTWVDQ